ncbi:MAG: DUF59 domain-containing protein [Chloroflexi bacterium]|nr:DUF59 domain-containing protein [Chloroflexota bacterium]
MTMLSDQEHLRKTITEALQSVTFPGYSRDIVSFGLVKKIAAVNGGITVEMEINSTRPATAIQIQADAERVLQVLPQLKGLAVKVEVKSGPELPAPLSNGYEPRLSPLQDEAQNEGGAFDPDPLIAATLRPDLAAGAGYDEDGPAPLGGPMGDRTSTRREGEAPVFQWEIDPWDSKRQRYGETEVERDGWIFRMWWQVHSADLVYASISAIAEEEEDRPLARRHPIGRNIAVNLVYDLRRRGVVAIYGTAQDFRPFVGVFLEGFGIMKRGPAAEATSAQPQP